MFFDIECFNMNIFFQQQQKKQQITVCSKKDFLILLLDFSSTTPLFYFLSIGDKVKLHAFLTFEAKCIHKLIFTFLAGQDVAFSIYSKLQIYFAKKTASTVNLKG